MYAFNVKVSLGIAQEQVDGKNLFIREIKMGFITETRAIKVQSKLTDITDIHL